MKTAKPIITEADLNPSCIVGWYTDASPEAVNYVLAQDQDDDGRSSWTWIRLGNGDLVLAVFPRGDTYHYVSEGDAEMEYPPSEHEGTAPHGNWP